MEQFAKPAPLNVTNSSSSRARRSRLVYIAVAVSLSFILALLIVNFGTKVFFLALAAIAALPVIYSLIAYPQKGILILLAAAYVIMFFGRFNTGFPIGTVMDMMIFLLIIGFFLKQKYEQDWRFLNSSVSVIIIVWVGYNLLEALNPAAESLMAWLYSVRPFALVTITYFIFSYFIRDVKFIRIIFKLWIFLSFIAAVYALKQEYFGFSGFELNYLKSDPIITALFYIGNHWRKFSIFSDPVSFAYNMVISSILCFSLMTGPLSFWKKAILALLGCLFFIAMLYSGTRSAYILYPTAYMFFCILKYNRKIMLISALILLTVVCLIYVPTSNYTLYRFQTAFKPDKDASYNLRKANQKKIQPYILSHPLGGGEGSTGVWGKRFSPYSYLANFPPDSGYVRVAVELGWIGLLLFCTFIFIVLKTGINNFFSISDPELKSYCLAMVLIVFALNIGNYPQEALVQYPINIYFYLAIALLNITLKLDKKTLLKRPISAYGTKE